MLLLPQILLLSLMVNTIRVSSLELKQVLMLSRHNIRAPFIDDIRKLTRKTVPKLNVPNQADLTEKGAMLEEGMGEYCKILFKNEAELPMEDLIHVYVNDTERTIKTARMFVRGALKHWNKNITIHVQNHERKIYNALVSNSSEEFRIQTISEMQEKINKLNFTSQYNMINEILNLNNSDICDYDNICDFNKVKQTIEIKAGEEPTLSDPYTHANLLIDRILMTYYDGSPFKDIAWGAFNNSEEFKALTEVAQTLESIKFGNYLVAKDTSKPLLKYMADSFINKKPKYTLLFGHDTNIKLLLAAIKVKPYIIENHYERAPIGGKVLFQKWYDEKKHRDLFRLNYIYQTVHQIRYGIKASTANPPESHLLQIEGCDMDKRGFCAWEDFMKMLLHSLD